eukprot:TRINITY_DN1526_c0_g1_i1.p1 TRINITY_DN1526_c0_g1~~TRINITY_DN1526_c0_g1_i1.p1  ORF type:complete len:464 (-),score=94.17 TRINITY_DN1526_c0_g1_i1:78-1469(-)
MIAGIFFFNTKGEVLISRLYRDGLSRNLADFFRLQVIHAKDIRSPLKWSENTCLLHIRVENVFVMAATRQNVNAALVFEVLYSLVSLFSSFFGGSFNEETIRNNFILIYELLDEAIDYGWPQTSGDEALKLYITQKAVTSSSGLAATGATGAFGFAFGSSSKRKANEQDEKTKKALGQITGIISWRAPDIKYKKNEIFIDVVESVNLLMSANSNLLRADVSGEIKMKAYLSGMPDCRFGINDKLLMDAETKKGGALTHKQPIQRRANSIELDDCTFHQCVRLGNFDTDRTISFIPPDGEFVLLKYRTTENINLPFKVLSHLNEIGRSRVEIKVTVKSEFSPKNIGNDVIITIPTPKNTATTKVTVTAGRAKYTPAEEAILWKVKRFPGGSEYALSAELELSASVSLEKKAWVRPPISMQFNVPMFTSSGMQVRYLKVVESKLHYTAIKWVRYVTKAGSYQFRF